MIGRGLVYWCLAAALYVVFAASLWTFAVYKFRKDAKTSHILEDNFKDWKDKGIKVKYQRFSQGRRTNLGWQLHFALPSASEESTGYFEPMTNNILYKIFKSVFIFSFILLALWPFCLFIVVPMWKYIHYGMDTWSMDTWKYGHTLPNYTITHN